MQALNSVNISFLIKPAAYFSQSVSREVTGNSTDRMHLRASALSLTMLANVAALNVSGAKFKQWVNPTISLANRLYSVVSPTNVDTVLFAGSKTCLWSFPVSAPARLR